MGYDIVFQLVDDTGIRDEIRDQVNNLGDYLAENGYLLVRPNGGFTARGASGSSVALEFPFGQVFERITGNPYRPRVGFEGALGKAGLWESLKGPLMWGTIGGILGPVIVVGSGAVVGATLGILDPGLLFILGTLLAITAPLGFIIGRAAVLYLHRNVFDVWDISSQGEFALAYLLKKWPSIKQRFQVAFLWLKSHGGCAVGFPPSIGLTGLDDNDQAVRNAYLDWFEGRRESGLEPFEKGFGALFGIDHPDVIKFVTLLDKEIIPELLRLHFVNNNISLAPNATVIMKEKSSIWWIQSGQHTYVIKKEGETKEEDITIRILIRIYEKGVEKLFAQAVAVILGAGPVEERNLAQLLQKKYDIYHAIWKDSAKTMWKGDLTIRESEYTNYDTDDGMNGASGIPVATEDIMPDLDYMAALALTWLHTKKRIDNGTPIPSEVGFPTVPASTTNWPPATIPGYVYDAAASGNITLPLDAIPWEGEIRPDDIDVFGGAEPLLKPTEDPPVKLKPENEKQLVDVRQWTVRESDSLVDTGAAILPEDTITFNASGEIWAGIWLTGKNGPNGWNIIDPDQKFPLKDSHPYCLLARIGEWGNWMFVGTQNTYPHPIDGSPGRLYLRINDDKPGNGSGEFLCHIEVKR
jgi:hypothetical protein